MLIFHDPLRSDQRLELQVALPLVEMSDGEDFELDSDKSFGFTENENDAAWMTIHVAIQIAILIVAHVYKSALFVLFALFSQVGGRAFNFALCMPAIPGHSNQQKNRFMEMQVLMLLVFIKAKGLTDAFGNALITVSFLLPRHVT